MRRIPVWALKPGMIVDRPVYDINGSLLLNRGRVLKKEYIHRLKRMDIPFLYIRDSFIPDVNIEDVILDETRNRAISAARSVLEEAFRKQPGKNSLHLIMEKSNFGEIVDDIIDQLLGANDLMVNMADIRSTDNYTFAHSVNVAVLALTTAISLGGYGRRKMREIGSGSLLHDLGKIKIPLEILNKEGPLEEEEFEIVQEHPLSGYEIVSQKDILEDAARDIILQHHERNDGNGYPKKMIEEEINPLAKMVAISDVYDALTSDRPYREGFLPHEAMDLMEIKGDEFDIDMLRALFHHVAAYPLGTFVELSSGELGVVVKNKAGYPRHPRVRIFFAGEEKERVKPFEVNLRGKVDQTVVRVLKEDEISKIPGGQAMISGEG